MNPFRLWSALAGRPAAMNFLWLAADRGVRLFLSLIVVTWVARYLGESDFGALSYAMALATVFGCIAPLGMEQIALREVARDESRATELLSTVIAFRLGASVVCGLLAVASTQVFRPREPLILGLVLVFAIGFLIQSFESGEILFQARGRMRELIMLRLGVAGVAAILKIAFILCDFRVLWFAIATAFEQALSGCVTWLMLRRRLPALSIRCIDWKVGTRLLNDCWPLAVGGLAVVLYIKAGQLMVGQFLGDERLGVYAAAIRIPEAAAFLPVVLGYAMLPGIVRNREMGEKHYKSALLRYFRINALMAYAVCGAISIGSDWIAALLYKGQYAGAGKVMGIYAWALLFIFLGVSRGQYLLNEKLTGYSLLFSVLGFILNLAANLLLIPRFGLAGAAFSTVIAYGSSNLLISFVLPKTREIGIMQGLALLTPWMPLTTKPNIR